MSILGKHPPKVASPGREIARHTTMRARNLNKSNDSEFFLRLVEEGAGRFRSGSGAASRSTFVKAARSTPKRS